jgi:pantothenate synthetase
MEETLLAAGMKIDYVALADPDTLAHVDTVTASTVALVAARVGKTRLIDNATMDLPLPDPQSLTPDP